MPSLAIASCHAVARGDDAQAATIRALRIELARKDDRIEELQILLGLSIEPPPLVRIAPYPLKILGLLLIKPRVTTAMIETAIYGDLPFGDWPINPPAAIKVHVNHLRNTLSGHQITFDTIREGNGPCGYAMTPTMKAQARAVFGFDRVRS
jgi:hypothetical protein